MQLRSQGIDPAKNGARIFWRAMGPFEMSEEEYASLCQALEIDEVDSDLFLRTLDDSKLRKQLSKSLGLAPPEDDDFDWQDSDEPRVQQIESLVAAAKIAPWGSDDSPDLANWVIENQLAFTLLREAASKEQWFSPPTNWQNAPKLRAFELDFADFAAIRPACDALAVRANYCLGLGDLRSAWTDAKAILRYAHHYSSGCMAPDLYFSSIQRSRGLRVTQAILASDKLNAELATEIESFVNGINPLNGSDCVTTGERLYAIDYVISRLIERTGENDQTRHKSIIRPLMLAQIDINQLLTEVNRWYDRLAIIHQENSIVDRLDALNVFSDDVVGLKAGFKAEIDRGAVWFLLNRDKRTLVPIAALVVSTAGNLEILNHAIVIDETRLQLTKIAIALANYRREQSEYPTKLAQVPQLVDLRSRLDPCSQEPLKYERRGTGYLLYSVFLNSTDDGGDDYSGRVIDGEWVDEKVELGFSTETDLVIRLPLPKPNWPKAK